ncbi:alpha/beta fold hydrolase [Streptomyces sp. NPDC086010]|uniref:alpha/beta fold hydrolase n=1 Tax=Streptomyces sp. NPDC086010 TaxID=3365745 RepID=UPI0037CF4E74
MSPFPVAPLAPGGEDHSHRPTVVLVHGAFTDSSVWAPVVTRLRDDGFPVVAATVPLRGLSADAACVNDLVNSVDGSVVLVGHSYGGAVIGAAADGAENVKALVYIAAFIPDEGESVADLVGMFPGSTLCENLREVLLTGADGSRTAELYIQQDMFHQQFAADLPRDRADLLAVIQRPITADVLQDEAVGVAWQTIPTWALIADQDRVIPAEAQTYMTERALSYTVTVEASHAVALSQPDAVARLIREAAEKTS